MDPVKVAKMGTHTMVSGSDKRAVEAKVAELVVKGSKLISKVEALGRNWVATLEDQAAAPDTDGCRVARLGLQSEVLTVLLVRNQLARCRQTREFRFCAVEEGPRRNRDPHDHH